ncbi:nucleotidyltransferase domain-containing protein [Anabaena aphanizomenioides LEGE 00250]|uniref:Nucleotidyltransferase domain-containing protein n=1 Tax=Sphaerospermopsis aphanizomenoides LEGE 00250 TaxID=2777972 RepID=A0ABR9VCQ6_9CYAN|nr:MULTISPECIES: nucleotidyltransferase domain-containing protein [Sphaerospermopsis]MBC5797569.1 nucleotidyltransferase domain-containing protein [Sphaerospermopsis sp. LEGE 00249]MBE9235970.1 nucleotidyltransferase domain-containing protein [Sphaerospermopsis aphanizomenoides LEGE 00250]
METLTVNRILEEVKAFLQKTYQDNLDKVILFGSRARGDHHADSDLDILIVLKEPFNYSQEVEKTSIFISELSLEFDLVISRVFAETKDFNSKNTPFFMNVRKEGVIL